MISSYSGPEREFLIAMGKLLGACVQERLVRKAAPLLVCKEPSGAKYNAAIQWELTVVRAEWLRECTRQKRRVAENPYLVGDAICSAKNVAVGAGACLPMTSTDDVDIDSVREEARIGEPAREEELSMHPQASSTMKPVPKTTGDQFRYITVQKTREETEYGFTRLSTPQLRQLTSGERMQYSQEMDQYEELMKAQRVQRKPFDPNEGSVYGQVAADSPAAGDVLRTRRFTAISEEGRGSSSSRSPITPVAGAGAGAAGSSTNVTPAGAGIDYEALSVTQRVMEFDTPVRNTLYKVLKEAEEAERNITPRTRRVKELLATPHGGGPGAGRDGHIRTPTLPDCMTKPVTPYGFRPDASPDNHAYHKRKLQYWDRYHKPSTSNTAGTASAAGGPSDPVGDETASQRARRLSTPISEIKRRFYVEKFGEDYVNHVESKCSTMPRKTLDLNRSGEETDEEIASTAPPPPAPQSRKNGGSPPTTVATGGGERSADTSTISRGSLDRGNVSADKRSRSELEQEEDDYGDPNATADKCRSPTGDETDLQPVAKKPLLNAAKGDAFVQRLSDVIAAAKESAKKKAKYQLEADTEQQPTEPYTEIDYDTGG